MEAFWCDDGRDNNDPAMLYECKCGKEYAETSEGLIDITQTEESIKESCSHIWVYANRIYTSLPPQRDRICSKCGKQECVTMGIKTPFEDTYEGIVEKFKPSEKLQ